MIDVRDRNETDLHWIKTIAKSDNDGPALMINLNTYKPEAGFPDGSPYRDYMAALQILLNNVGGKILWRLPVRGQVIGAQPADEILAAWYPSHRAFLNMTKAPGAEENFRLRELVIETAVIHRCDADAFSQGSNP